MSLNLWTTPKPILKSTMRRLFVLGAFAVVLAVPATSQADRPPQAGPPQPSADGCLVISGGNGLVSIWADGALIGRIEVSGTLTVEDLNPGDQSKARVFGDDSRIALTKTKMRYTGLNNLRFRITGGGPYHVVVQGIGIDLSAIGDGRALIDGSRYDQTGGSYTADTDSLCASGIKSFPDTPTRVVLGTPTTG
jgi:hypothetical protein